MVNFGVHPIEIGGSVRAYGLFANLKGCPGIREAVVTADGFNIISERARIGRQDFELLRTMPLEDAIDFIDRDAGNGLAMFNAAAVPWAGRIWGSLEEDGIVVSNPLSDPVQQVSLPANGLPDRVSVNGIAYGLPYQDIRMPISDDGSQVTLSGKIEFGEDQWFSPFTLTHMVTLSDGSLVRSYVIHNTGTKPLPIGAGDIPYFTVPTGQASNNLSIKLLAFNRVGTLEQQNPLGSLRPPMDLLNDSIYKYLFGKGFGNRPEDKMCGMGMDLVLANLLVSDNTFLSPGRTEFGIYINFPQAPYSLFVGHNKSVNAVHLKKPSAESQGDDYILASSRTHLPDPLNPEWLQHNLIKPGPLGSSMHVLQPRQQLFFSTEHRVFPNQE